MFWTTLKHPQNQRCSRKLPSELCLAFTLHALVLALNSLWRQQQKNKFSIIKICIWTVHPQLLSLSLEQVPVYNWHSLSLTTQQGGCTLRKDLRAHFKTSLERSHVQHFVAEETVNTCALLWSEVRTSLGKTDPTGWKCSLMQCTVVLVRHSLMNPVHLWGADTQVCGTVFQMWGTEKKKKRKKSQRFQRSNFSRL